MKQLQETSKAVDGVQEEPLKHTYFFWQNFNEISENIKSYIHSISENEKVLHGIYLLSQIYSKKNPQIKCFISKVQCVSMTCDFLLQT